MAASAWVLIWMSNWILIFWRNRYPGRFQPAQRAGFYRSEKSASSHRHQCKPAWVQLELVKLKAHMPDAGCRTLALTFNRLFAHRKTSVCKTTAHKLLRDQAHAVALARREMRSKQPHACAVNNTWGIDMTGRADAAGQIHTILGIVDHGSRRALLLKVISRKSSWQLLSWLCLTIDRFGKPQSVRTDNERCFTSAVFGFGLKLMGIHHQKTHVGCPWQNGRVERFFGTLKQRLKQVKFDNRKALASLLHDFDVWYNQIRPHQNLGGSTPYEAWQTTQTPEARLLQPPKKIHFIRYWDDLLCGFYIQR